MADRVTISWNDTNKKFDTPDFMHSVGCMDNPDKRRLLLTTVPLSFLL